MHFTKMHGLGNDYLYVYGEVPENIAAISRRLSDRHFGAGADGMIYISHSDTADFKMRIFNADGSEGKMCGNGIRCVGKYVFEKGYTDKTTLKIETLSGIKTLSLKLKAGKVESVSVAMGRATVEEPIAFTWKTETYSLHPTDMGNPHAVIFTRNVEKLDIAAIGTAIQGLFTGGSNVEFVEVLGNNKLRMRVWERGSGITLACGTGACASAAAAVHEGLCERSQTVSVVLDGGILKIGVGENNEIQMTGPAAFIYEGETEI